MSLSPLQRYEQAISTGEFTRDEQQYQAMSYLDELYHQLNDSVPQKKRFVLPEKNSLLVLSIRLGSV